MYKFTFNSLEENFSCKMQSKHGLRRLKAVLQLMKTKNEKHVQI